MFERCISFKKALFPYKWENVTSLHWVHRKTMVLFVDKSEAKSSLVWHIINKGRWMLLITGFSYSPATNWRCFICLYMLIPFIFNINASLLFSYRVLAFNWKCQWANRKILFLIICTYIRFNLKIQLCGRCEWRPRRIQTC